MWKALSLTGGALAAGLILCGATSRSARACSPSPCGPRVQLFGPNATVPADLVYFRVNPNPQLELRNEAGDIVPASVRRIGRDLVFAPDSPPVSGQILALTYPDQCLPAGGIYWFQVGPPSEPMPRPPALTVLERTLLPPTGTVEEVLVRVEYFPPDVSGSYRHITRYFPRVSDKYWPFDEALARTGRYVLDVKTRCLPPDNDWRLTPCSDYYQAPAGAHTIEVEAYVVGATEQPPKAQLTIDTSCARPSPPESAADPAPGGTPDPGSSSPVGPTIASGAGCSVASRADASPGLSLLLVLSLWAARRARQQRGPLRSSKEMLSSEGAADVQPRTRL